MPIHVSSAESLYHIRNSLEIRIILDKAVADLKKLTSENLQQDHYKLAQ